jgi:hypothetical protein
LIGLEMAEPALFPPVARFFIAILLILVVEGSAVIFALWLSSKYGKDE